MAVDSLGFGDALGGHARAARRRARGWRARSPASALPDADDVRPHRHARHGWFRHRRQHPAGGRHRHAARAGHRAQALPHARVRRTTAPSRSRCRTRATPRRRSRWHAARSRPAPRSSPSPAAVSWRASRAGVGVAARALPRRHPDAAPGARRAGGPALRRAVPHGHAARGARGLLPARRSSSRAVATSASPTVEGARNPARELARKIGRTIPIIYGSGGLGGVAALRWKQSVNENAKAPAFWNEYPELDHNEVCGWGQHGDVTRQVFTLVELRHGLEHARLEPRAVAHPRAHRGGAGAGAHGRSRG